MVARLAVGDATVGELADPYDVSVQAVSKHVKVLAEAGLVSQTKDAQRRPCHLEAEVFDLMTKWIDRYRQQAQARYERLDEEDSDTGYLIGLRITEMGERDRAAFDEYLKSK